MPQTLPAVQRRWLALQMLEGDIYSHRLAGPPSHCCLRPPGRCNSSSKKTRRW